ncbi:oligosaccharide flippase family protein [Vibrio cholerae]|nr:oligosaccharide flippase family protein [Vibrio cholerae]
MSTIKKAAGLSILQVVLGYFGFGALGLILSQIAFLLLGNKTLISNVLRQYSFTKLPMSDLKKTAKRYRAFFLLSLPAALANALVTHLTTLMISVYFNVSTLGLYSLAQKTLGIPSAFIGNAVSQVMLKIGSEEKIKTGRVINTFDSTLKKLIIVALPFYTIAYFFVEPAFEFFFGHEWLIAGLYAKISIPLFAARFIVSSLSAVDTICEKQHLFLIFNLVLLIVTVMIFFIFKSSDFITFLYYFSYSNALVYILYGFVLRYVAKCQK